MPRLTLAQCNNALGRLLAGAREQDVVRQFGVSRQTMSTLRTRYNTTLNVDHRTCLLYGPGTTPL